MTTAVQETPPLERLAAAFEHSITWEEDVWQADPVDVEEVHADARSRFFDLLKSVAGRRATSTPARIMLVHGQSGAGKTHLIRALRTHAHQQEIAYFGYAQMTPDVANYADYFLKRLIHSLEKPYNPHDPKGESGLGRLTRKIVEGCDADLSTLRDGDLDETSLAKLVHALADEIVSHERFADQELDINIIRALLYLQRADPRVDQRIRTYLCGRPLTALSHASVQALDTNTGDGRAFEILEALGRIMLAVDGAALVFCIDQVEDLRFFDDAEERFQRAVRDLIQLANRLPSAIVVISCLEDFYEQVRGVVAQSYIDRIEKSGPVALLESRTAEEAELIITKRIARECDRSGATHAPDPAVYFGPDLGGRFGGLSTRKLLQHAQEVLMQQVKQSPDPDVPAGLVSSLAAALGFGDSGKTPDTTPPRQPAHAIDYREIWERFVSGNEAELAPDSDDQFTDVLAATLRLAEKEWSGELQIKVSQFDAGDDTPTLDLTVRHGSGHTFESRIFLCNKPTQGGGFKRQLDRVIERMDDRMCFLLRASEFPPTNRKNQTAQAYRKYKDAGGRSLIVPIPEWERMLTAREFHLHHRQDPGFGDWFTDAKLVSALETIAQLLRLDLVAQPSRSEPSRAQPTSAKPSASEASSAPVQPTASGPTATEDKPAEGARPGSDQTNRSWSPLWADWTGWDSGGIGRQPQTPEAEGAADNDPNPAADVPPGPSVEEIKADTSKVFVGDDLSGSSPIALPRSTMKRHAAVLGGSGSGKTTLALNIIEQTLLRGVPAILIDRKGDLCSYANPDVWREIANEPADRRSERERLGDAIDVAVYTPGRASGRPISITLLPKGINELPGHEQQLLANLSAAALGDMLHLKNSATHQKQSGTLSVALRILGSRFSRAVTLADLINLLEEEDPELTELTQRMDPSGKLRRDLVAQLDSLRHRNSALFDGAGEDLRMESLLGLGSFAQPGRTRLSVIYTGFLGDNENILFWVSQFLSEALRFCQRNPNEELQALVMLDEADLYIPANAKPATAEPLQSLLKRARSAGLGLMLATQSPGDLDYKSRDQITSWFIGRVREDTALRKLKAAFQSESGLDPTLVLPNQTVGEFHLVQEGRVRALKAQRSLIQAEQVPFDRIEMLANETESNDTTQLPLFEPDTAA
ncbi:MAG: BREX system ATP-binding domain-containing protein [Pseudomonadota bacterium]